ncbi:MAG TPA: hypothetical protein VFY06_11960 [Verrucomicrobiae bacterium]|nr:hypothetical protein [Verrucomicrobiae bacterium]
MKQEQIEILREVFEEWLLIHDLDYDFWIYTGEEWRARGEKVLQNAEAVLAFENQHVSLFDHNRNWDVDDELQDLSGGFGYSCEMGHPWSMGFFPLAGLEALPSPSAPYLQLMQHSRWQVKCRRILLRSGGNCEECGTEGRSLEVHHCYYRHGRLPWQYPDGALLALCQGCQSLRGRAELRFRMFRTPLSVRALEQMRRDYRNRPNAG